MFFLKKDIGPEKAAMLKKEYVSLRRDWRQAHVTVLMISSIILLVSEILMFFLMKGSGYILSTGKVYALKYFAFPAICCIILNFLAFFAHRSSKLNDSAKNCIVSLSVAGLAFVIAIVHGLFPTAAGYFAAVVLTVIYGDYGLTTITGLSSFVMMLLSSYVIVWDTSKPSGEDYNISMVVMLVIFVCVYAICMVIINFELRKQLMVAEHETERRKLRRMVNWDKLTGVYNRMSLEGYMNRLEKEGVKGFSVAMMDLDDFKSVNDIYGHAAGDNILSLFGTILSELPRELTVPFRYGGDEFLLVIFSGDRDVCRNLLKKVQSDFKERYPDIYSKCNASVSVGVAYMDESRNYADVVKLADSALYKAKDGKNQKIIFA